MTTTEKKGRYGKFGGQFVPETLMTALEELEQAFETAKQDPAFYEELNYYLKDYVGRDNPLYFATSPSAKCVPYGITWCDGRIS